MQQPFKFGQRNFKPDQFEQLLTEVQSGCLHRSVGPDQDIGAAKSYSFDFRYIEGTSGRDQFYTPDSLGNPAIRRCFLYLDNGV